MSEDETQENTDPTTIGGDTSMATEENTEETAASDEAGGELEAVVAERDRLKDQLLRTAAELDNFRKRTKRDLLDAEHRGRESVLREVLPVVDNLERAVGAAANATDVADVVEGVQMVLKSFNEVGKNLGLERIAGVGERFDPAVHDAIQQIESADHEPGTVVAEILAGYRLREKLLRASMVVVSKLTQRPAATDEGGADQGGQTGDEPGAQDANEEAASE